ncbi:MAG: hypothetical protein KKD31_11420, partial [Bacteroidetes bacterium]|nr:hypothetical protein [Bacteroidota bacterium]
MGEPNASERNRVTRLDTWNGLTTNVSDNLNDVWINSTFAIAVGDDGTILRWEPPSTTVDGVTCTIPSGVGLRSVQFVDENTGYILTSHGRVLKSTDNGLNWEFLDGIIYSGLNSMSFTSQGHGIIAGEDGTIISFEDMSDSYSSRFWYDRLGRIVVSQNAEQFETNKYSFTTYDDLGRIVKSGELVNIPASQRMSDLIANNDDLLEDFINNNDQQQEQQQVVTTIYDNEVSFSVAGFDWFEQENLRNRVSQVKYQEIGGDPDDSYHAETTYTYDIHGNVSGLVHSYYYPNPDTQGDPIEINKGVKYIYDLVSGNVNQVIFQPGDDDQFMHKYEYDAD